MNKTNFLTHQIRFTLGVVLLTLTGCIGVVGPGHVHAYVPVPEVVVFGGFERGGYDHDAGRRGYESRYHDHDRR
ncbi:MAG: hypothetical protein JWR19_162 [Pedosphaera sp.]|jgi:hypothetical protein|nr:hypothetical protein [Pedosphaera sp.]